MTPENESREKLTLSRKLLIVGAAVLSVVLLIGAGSYLYAWTTANKVQPLSYTGNPSLAEKEISDMLAKDPENIDRFFLDPDSTMPAALWSNEDWEDEDDPRIMAAEPSARLSGSAEPAETDQTTVSTSPIATPIPTPVPHNKELISQAEKANDLVHSQPVLKDDNMINILLIGSDTRILSEYGRSDTMIILSINKSTGKIHLASLMRALYVYIPGHGRSLLNAAFSWGGPNLLIKTIESNFRIKLNHYMYIDFGGFQKAIDILGGVDISLTQKEAEHMGTITSGTFSAGVNHLNGTQALAYSRIRKIDWDFTRTSRQRSVLSALIKKARLSDAATVASLVNQLISQVKSNIPSSELVSLAVQGGTTYVNYPISEILIPLSNDTTRTFTGSGAEVWTYSWKSVNALHRFLSS